MSTLQPALTQMAALQRGGAPALALAIACRTHLHLTLQRHDQFVDFPLLVTPEQRPRFHCRLPAWTIRRGPIAWWVWEPCRHEGLTRLWVPTELTWWIYFLGEKLGRYVPIPDRLPGGRGFAGYCDRSNWFMTFLA